MYAETASNLDCRDPSALQQLQLLGKGGKTAAKLQVSSGSDQQGEFIAVTVGNSGKFVTVCVHVAVLKLQVLVQEHKVAIALHFSLPSWWMCPLCRSFASAPGHVSLS